jgi:hypothetical protein
VLGQLKTNKQTNKQTHFMAFKMTCIDKSLK